MFGLGTLVTILVDSVTSTCLRSSFGDMRTYSAPTLPVSSGALPGHTDTTSGSSAAVAEPATTPDTTIKETAHALRFTVAPLGAQICRQTATLSLAEA